MRADSLERRDLRSAGSGRGWLRALGLHRPAHCSDHCHDRRSCRHARACGWQHRDSTRRVCRRQSGTAELQARRRPGQLCRTYPGTLTRGEKRILMSRDPALQGVVDEWLARAVAAGEPARELERAMQAYVSDNAVH